MTNPGGTSSPPRARDLFSSALDLPSGERTAFLNRACAGDAALRREVEDLLCEHDQVGSFLETPALGDRNAGPRPRGNLDAMEKAGDRIDRYKLLENIGEGGCGVVYMAEQETPVRRRVALKIIKLGMDTRSVIARFEAERQALAMMDHPNIAKVLDAGATDTGRPYFVMELVRGIRITEYCEKHHVPTEQRLELFVQVCHAIQHAHQKGIIHRDIKPSNILVTLHDGTPVPKVIDFGIAKATNEQRLTDKTLFTAFEAFIGTPAYMSPEQAEMSGLDIDTRSDIYSLGVLLYELLTGKPPFDPGELLRSGIDGCRRTIREEEPPRPSTRFSTMLSADQTTIATQHRTDPPHMIHSLRGDLDWIVMKALEKDRTRRYETASSLAADIQRYLNGEPVTARPPSTWYRFQKFARRNGIVLAATCIVAVTLVGGIAVSAWQAVRATKAEHNAVSSRNHEAMMRKEAEQHRARAEQESAAAYLNEYVADINLSQQSLAAGNHGRAVQLLRKHVPDEAEPDLRGFEWRYLWNEAQGDEHVALPAQGGGVQAIAFAPGGRFLAVGVREIGRGRGAFGQRDRLKIWDLRTRTLVTNLSRAVSAAAFFPDGKRLAIAGMMQGPPGRGWNMADMGSIRILDVDDWTTGKTLADSAMPMALSQDGTTLAAWSRHGIHVWNTATWEQQHQLGLEAEPALGGPPGFSGPIAISRDGRSVAADTAAGIKVWRFGSTQSEVLLQDSTNIFGRNIRNDAVMAFSADAKSIVAARNTLSERGVFVLTVWDAETGKEITVMPDDPEHIEHTGAISALAFSQDGRTLATASMDYSLRTWDFTTRQRIEAFHGHLSEVWALAFSPDGDTIATGGKDGAVNLWRTHRTRKNPGLPGTWQPVAFARDNRTMAALNRSGAVAIFDTATGEGAQQLQLTVRPDARFGWRFRGGSSVSMNDDLTLLADAREDGTVDLWNTATREAKSIKVGEGRIDSAVLSPDGLSLVTGGGLHHLKWWDLRAGTNFVMANEGQKVVFSRDGRTLAAVQRGNVVQMWNVASHERRTNFTIEVQPFADFALSFDGRMLAAAGLDDAILLYDTADGKLIGTCSGHKQSVASVAFSPDGRTLASASDDSTLKLWNVATQQELLSIRRLGGALRALTFSSDGTVLAAGGSFSQQSGGLRFYRGPAVIDVPSADEDVEPTVVSVAPASEEPVRSR